ncbi:MAG: DUF1273 family protein [Oscillospiraceae bacterium]|nr:DUF1273 family protein [Oscillospiraceae bacterium]
MKDKTCCFTGHRDIPPQEVKKVKALLLFTIEKLIERGVVFYGSGGALGFDTLAAQAVLELKEKYPQIKLIMVYPCKDQTAFWNEKDIAEYNRIKAACDKVVYTSEKYDKACMFKRNRHLVNHSGYCVCYLKKPSGGTAYTVNYAKDNGLAIINIA